MYKIIENPQDGDEVQYLGVYVLKWQSKWGKPSVAFVEIEDEELLLRYKKVVKAARDVEPLMTRIYFETEGYSQEIGAVMEKLEEALAELDKDGAE